MPRSSFSRVDAHRAMRGRSRMVWDFEPPVLLPTAPVGDAPDSEDLQVVRLVLWKTQVPGGLDAEFTLAAAAGETPACVTTRTLIRTMEPERFPGWLNFCIQDALEWLRP